MFSKAIFTLSKANSFANKFALSKTKANLFTNKVINFKIKPFDTEYSFNANFKLTKNKFIPCPEAQRIVRLMLADDITKPTHIKIDPNIINTKYNFITKEFIKRPVLLQLMLRYPSTILIISFGMLLGGVSFEFDSMADFFVYQGFMLGCMVSGLINSSNIKSSYARVFDVLFRLPFSNCGIGILARYRINQIHQELFKNYNGNVEYISESKISNKYLINIIINYIISENENKELVDNIVKSNKAFYENNLQIILIHMFDSVDLRTADECYKNKFKNILDIFKTYFPDTLSHDFIISVKDDTNYTFKDYCRYYKLLTDTC